MSSLQSATQSESLHVFPQNALDQLPKYYGGKNIVATKRKLHGGSEATFCLSKQFKEKKKVCCPTYKYNNNNFLLNMKMNDKRKTEGFVVEQV